MFLLRNKKDSIFWMKKTGIIHIREMSRKLKNFHGQGIVREFCDVSGKNENFAKMSGKCQEILHFSPMKLECLVPMYLFC